MSKVRVRTSYVLGNERLVLIGNVDKDELARQMKTFASISKKEGLRPGETHPNKQSSIAVSPDAMACINAMTHDGGFPLHTQP